MASSANYPPPPDDPPPDYNPEALEDIERGTFRNVDEKAASQRTALTKQPSQAAESATTTTPVAEEVKKVELGQMMPLKNLRFRDQVALLFVFSLIVMIQSSSNCANNSVAEPFPCTEINAYSVATGVVSMVFCMILMLNEARIGITENQKLMFSAFSFLWWLCAMIVLTFFGPFKTVYYANGYFGTWGAFIVSLAMFTQASEIFRRGLEHLTTGVNRRPVMYLFIASLVEIGASIDDCIPHYECVGLDAFAIALGSISAGFCIVLMPFMYKMTDNTLRNAGLFFCAWWVIGGMIVTFRGPFKTLGNGYFSVYAAILASFNLLQASQPEDT